MTAWYDVGPATTLAAEIMDEALIGSCASPARVPLGPLLVAVPPHLRDRSAGPAFRTARVHEAPALAAITSVVIEHPAAIRPGLEPLPGPRGHPPEHAPAHL